MIETAPWLQAHVAQIQPLSDRGIEVAENLRRNASALRVRATSHGGENRNSRRSQVALRMEIATRRCDFHSENLSFIVSLT